MKKLILICIFFFACAPHKTSQEIKNEKLIREDTNKKIYQKHVEDLFESLNIELKGVSCNSRSLRFREGVCCLASLKDEEKIVSVCCHNFYFGNCEIIEK